MGRLICTLCLFVLCGCHRSPDDRFHVSGKGVAASYDPTTGRLKRLEVDTNKNGVIDSWTTMDGAKIIQIEIDRDEDGRVDRWEHFDADRLVRVGSSTRGDGIEDQWAYSNADDQLSRVETDLNRDGRIDKWEAYVSPRPGAAPVLTEVASEPDANGKPTFRMYYRPDGSFDRAERSPK